MNPHLCVLVALLSTASMGLAQAPHAAIVTGEVHNPPSRDIEFHHEPLLAPGPSEHPIVLDEQNRFALLLNTPKGIFVTGHYKGEQYFLIPFFVEPGDSLHAIVTFAEVAEADSSGAVEPDSLHSAADEAPPSYTLTFSGRGAENNRFLAEFRLQLRHFRPDYALEPEAFVRQVEQRRRDEFALLGEGREQYALSPGFIDYMTAFFNYKWADQTISYPMFSFRNGVLTFSTDPSDKRAVPPNYYDFLQEIPLVDEKAIGVREYRSFLANTLDLEAKSDRPTRLSDRYKLSGVSLSESVRAQLDSMKEQLAAQPVVFLNISLDAHDGAWKQAIAKHQIQGIHVRSDGAVTQTYNVSGIPRYYLVDPQGLIVESHWGVSNIDKVVAKIEEHL